MVGAINAPSSGNTYEAFSAAARALAGSQPPTTDPTTVVTDGPGVASAGSSSSARGSGTSTGTATAASGTSTGSSALQLTANAGLSLLGGALAFFAA